MPLNQYVAGLYYLFLNLLIFFCLRKSIKNAVTIVVFAKENALLCLFETVEAL